MNEREKGTIKACVFDAYGTLLDFNSAVAAYQDQVGDFAADVSELWRRKQLEYTWLRSLMRRYKDFWHVTGDALDYALETYGINDAGLRDNLLEAHRTLSPYPEVPKMLRALKEAGTTTAILSNGSPQMLVDAVESAEIKNSLDYLFSVEEVGIFKPAPDVYQIASSRLGLPADSVLFMSSNAWDIHGASTFGFRCVWINRGKAPHERLPNGPIKVLETLEPLPEFVANS